MRSVTGIAWPFGRGVPRGRAPCQAGDEQARVAETVSDPGETPSPDAQLTATAAGTTPASAGRRGAGGSSPWHYVNH
jgi:hypothetical protein